MVWSRGPSCGGVSGAKVRLDDARRGLVLYGKVIHAVVWTDGVRSRLVPSGTVRYGMARLVLARLGSVRQVEVRPSTEG